MKNVVLTAAGATLLLASTLAAQDPPPIVFGQYFRCNQGMEARADEIALEVMGPAAQRQVDAGNLTGWGWLTHVQGGAWRRGLFSTGTDMAQMMGARAAIIEEITSDNADELAELGTICPGHDDYIWTGVANSTANPDGQGPVTMSTYHMCDRGKEGRADQIFTDELAPLYQKHIDLGHIATYGYFAHRSGGVFRRLETLSGPDHLTLLNMQAAVYQEADPVALQEFSSICSTHTDYMWGRAN